MKVEVKSFLLSSFLPNSIWVIKMQSHFTCITYPTLTRETLPQSMTGTSFNTRVYPYEKFRSQKRSPYLIVISLIKPSGTSGTFFVTFGDGLGETFSDSIFSAREGSSSFGVGFSFVFRLSFGVGSFSFCLASSRSSFACINVLFILFFSRMAVVRTVRLSLISKK